MKLFWTTYHANTDTHLLQDVVNVNRSIGLSFVLLYIYIYPVSSCNDELACGSARGDLL